MFRTTLTSFALAACLSGVAVAQTPTPPAKEKRVCKNATTIGTLVPQRTCHTPTEWKAIADANDRSMQQLRQENNPGTNQSPQ